MRSPLLLRNGHAPTHYGISLTVNHEKANFTGSVVIRLRRSGTVQIGDDYVLMLNSSELVLTSALFIVGDDQVKAKVVYEKADQLVRISVEDSSLWESDQLLLKISYIGKINTIKTYEDVTKGLFKTNYLDDRSHKATSHILGTHAQTSYARCLFPCVDEPVSKARFKLDIETAAAFKVLSNTSPESKNVDEKANIQTVHFKETKLMTPSIFGFVIGDLDFIEANSQLSQGSVPIRFYTTIGSIAGAAYALDVATRTLPFIESLFGLDYPLDKLDIVALPFLSDGAMENNGLITIQAGHVLIQSLSNKTATQAIRQLIVHEIIHHWIGNNVSFDEWEHIWLNEAFATWFANYALYKLDMDPLDTLIWENQVDDEMESMLVQDSSLAATTVVLPAGKEVKSTQDAFQIPSYRKGMQFLRMFANTFEGSFDDNLPHFTQTLVKFVKTNELKTIKPTDLWMAFHEDSSLDLLAFSHSWLRLPGYPLVSVTLNKEGKIVIEQNRYLDHSSPAAENLENAPYHVPLAIKLSDGSVVNKVLNDRKLVLEEINAQEFVNLNTNRTGFYRVIYNSLAVLDNLANNSHLLSSMDFIGIFHDLSQIIGHDYLHSDIAVISLVKLSEKLMMSKDLDFKVLRTALSVLEILENSFKLYADEASYMEFSKWLVNVNSKLFKSLDWDSDYSKYSSDELQCRAMILSIGLITADVGKVCDKLFKQVLHGPPRSVPAHLLTTVMASVSMRANQNTWKKILELAKSPGATQSHIFAGSSADIQHGAISAIGFTKDISLVKRVLNFVTTNIESSLVETGLIGLQFNNEANKTLLWNWFKLNYDQWALKSCRAGSEASANMRKTLKSITVIVLSGMTREGDKRAVAEFVLLKLERLPEHELSETLKLVEEAQLGKIKISTSCTSLKPYL